jgi:carbon storage regulator
VQCALAIVLADKGKLSPGSTIKGVCAMLILSRRPRESVRIGNNVRITLLGFKGGQARIRIEAPPNVVVDREEVYLRKIEQSKQGDANGNG